MKNLILIGVLLVAVAQLGASTSVSFQSCNANTCSSCRTCAVSTPIVLTGTPTIVCPGGTFCYSAWITSSGCAVVNQCLTCADSTNSSCVGCNTMNATDIEDYCYGDSCYSMIYSYTESCGYITSTSVVNTTTTNQTVETNSTVETNTSVVTNQTSNTTVEGNGTTTTTIETNITTNDTNNNQTTSNVTNTSNTTTTTHDGTGTNQTNTTNTTNTNNQNNNTSNNYTTNSTTDTVTIPLGGGSGSGSGSGQGGATITFPVLAGRYLEAGAALSLLVGLTSAMFL